jgi:hypothetical protein
MKNKLTRVTINQLFYAVLLKYNFAKHLRFVIIFLLICEYSQVYYEYYIRTQNIPILKEFNNNNTNLV